MKTIKILFVGNSHTYNCDIPYRVQKLAAADGIDCQVAMNAHGGWTLHQHVHEPDVPFNLRYGGYDFAIFQEHAHPLDPGGHMVESLKKLMALAKEGGAYPILYTTWSQKHERRLQDEINAAYDAASAELGIMLSRVGEAWWDEMDAHPEVDLFCPDGGHASPAGAEVIAQTLWETLKKAMEEME
ncbi:MAG: SGNH/GDSL hydrolase family protein [Clostridia bacterium]|nr:SGNH/GDSL hydrolase family protein [Clostridia bacterium]